MTAATDSPGAPPATLRPALWVALAAAAVRLVYFADHAASPFLTFPVLDGKYYDTLARALVAGGDVARLDPGFRPLLYPLFLAACYRLGGGWDRVAAIAAQHLLGVATAVLLVVLASRLFRDARAGGVAGLLYLLAGPPLYFEGELLATTLFTFLVVVALTLLATAEGTWCRAPTRRWLTAALTLGLATQVRANALLLLAAFPLSALLFRRREGRARSRRAALALAVAAATVVLFALLERGLVGGFTLLPSSGGINLYLGNKRGADGRIPRQDRPVASGEEYRDSVELFAEAAYREATGATAVRLEPAALSRYWTRRALAEVAADPRGWLRLEAHKAYFLLWSHEIPNNKSYGFARRHDSRWLRYLPVGWWLLLALASLGVRRAWHRGERPVLGWIAAFLLLHAAGLLLFFVNSRYRIPLWPGLAALAAGGLLELGDRLRRRELRALAADGAVVAALAVLSLVPWAGFRPTGDARDYFFRSLANLDRGDLAGARRDVDASLALDPADAAALLQRGNVELAEGDAGAALATFRQVAAARPDEPRAANNVGVTLEELGSVGQAYAAYRHALSLAGGYVPALLNAARLELRAGLLDAARQHLERATATGYDGIDLTVLNAVLERRSGHEEAARARLAAARRRQPERIAPLLEALREPLSPAELGVGPDGRL